MIDERSPDGSRRFMLLRRSADWNAIRDHVSLLNGAKIANFIAEDLAERRLDFFYLGNRFLIHGQNGHFHLSVDDPQCSDLILYHVGRHFEQLQEAANQ